jgi:hypothetical protein
VGDELRPRPGDLTPDGFWRWDGAQWVPSGQAAPQALAPRRSLGSMWWLAGGCGLLVVVAMVAGLAFGGLALVNTIRSGGFNCVPSDFPAYPGATFSSVNVSSNGSSRMCTTVFESNSSPAAVQDFYEKHLSDAPWQVSPGAPRANEIYFINTTTHAYGSVLVSATGSGSEITIEFDK